MTASIDALDYLRRALQQDQISALVTQNPDGSVMISADIGPGSSNLTNTPLQGGPGAPGTDQFPIMPEPDIFPSPSSLPKSPVLVNTNADIGKFWIIAQQDGNGNWISVGAYIWYGTQFRFLPFGPAGPPGPYPVINPTVTLKPPNQTSTYTVTPQSGGGTPANPYSALFGLSIPQGPTGPGPTFASMADFLPLTPTVGQFVTANGQNVTFQGRVCPQWSPQNTGDLPLLPYIVPQSAFFAVNGISFAGLNAALPTVAGTIAQLNGFLGSVNIGIQSVLDGAITTINAVVNRGQTIGGVSTSLTNIQSSMNTLLSSIGSALTGSSPISQIAYAFNTFGGTITGTIQTNIDNLANLLGLGGSGHLLQHVSNAVQSTVQPVINAVNQVLNGTGIPTICAFTVPAVPWAWKPLVFGQIRMFEAEFSLQPLLMGLQVTLGWPGGLQIARGFGNTLSGVVNVVPHTSWPGNPSYAMNPYNNIGYVPANTPGAVFINVVNDGIAAIYDYNPSDAQIIVLQCPVTTQAQLGLSTPAALRNKVALSAASVHSP